MMTSLSTTTLEIMSGTKDLEFFTPYRSLYEKRTEINLSKKKKKVLLSSEAYLEITETITKSTSIKQA